MPVAIAAVEVYEGVAAWSAATTVLATVAAGAMVAGGAITLAGAAVGDKNMQQTGSLIGAAGSIGTVASNLSAASTASSAAADASAPAADTAATGTATPAELSATPTPMGPDAVSAPPATPAVPATGTAAATPAATADPNGIAAKLSAIKQSQDGLMKYNMVSGVLQGAGSAYSGWAQQQASVENQQRQLAFNQELADRANSVGSTGAVQPALAVGGGALYSGANSPGMPVASPTIPTPTALTV